MSDIEYHREEIPEVEEPSYEGTSYETRVPDTLDIAERVKLAINGLTNPTDADADYEIYWWADFFQHPTLMQHDYNDHVEVKFWEAIPLLRTVTGTTDDRAVDDAWRERLLKGIGPDGLFYFPKTGRPWTDRAVADRFRTVWGPDGPTKEISDDTVEQWTNTFINGRVLSVLAIYHEQADTSVWEETGERIVDRLAELAVDREDYSYFLSGSLEPHAEFDREAEPPTGLVSQELTGRVIEGLAHFYRATGYEPGADLAERLTTYQIDHADYFDEEGRFLTDLDRAADWRESDDVNFVGDTDQILTDDPHVYGAHFHSHTIALLSILEYALSVNDRDRIEFVTRSFEWAKTKESESSAKVGFFPEFIIPDYPSSETCEVADMISLGVKLSAAGVGDYWDEVSRWVRNQFAENQLTDTEWVDRVPARSGMPLSNEECGDYCSVDDVAERNLGAFAGWPSANDWTIRYGIMHCCTGNAARTLYYLWREMVDYNDDGLRVNLLLNRASPAADVHSYLPYVGRVEIKMKRDCENVSVRIPDLVSDTASIQCTVNGDQRSVRTANSYLQVGNVADGDTMTVTFPIEMSAEKERIGGTVYTLVTKGNSVVDIDPSGTFGPLYQRDRYKSREPSWREVQRFVPRETIDH